MDEFNNNQPQEVDPWANQPENPNQAPQINEQPQDYQPQQGYQQPVNSYGQQPYYGQSANYQQPMQGYSYAGDYSQPVQEKKGLAIASLICGIASIVLCCFYVGFPASIAGLITGIISLVKKNGGKGMAIAGIICSAIGVLGGAYMLFVLFALGSEGFWEAFQEGYNAGYNAF